MTEAPPANGFVALVHKLSRIAGVAASCMIGASVLIVCHLVFMRHVLGAPTTWQTELVTYLLVSATLIGSSYVLMVGGHVSVDLLPHYLRERGRRRLSLVTAAMGLFFCLVLFGSGVELWLDAWSGSWLSETVWAVRLWIPYSAIPIGFGLLLLQYVANVMSLFDGKSST